MLALLGLQTHVFFKFRSFLYEAGCGSDPFWDDLGDPSSRIDPCLQLHWLGDEIEIGDRKNSTSM